MDGHVTRLRRHPFEPGVDRRVARKVEPALVRDVRIRVQGDVCERVAIADEELASREPLLEPVERRVAPLRLRRNLVGKLVRPPRELRFSSIQSANAGSVAW